MMAEIYHKVTNHQEDELTGNFFGTIRYLPFTRGLNQIFKNYVVSEDFAVQQVLKNISENSFDFEFWKRSDKKYGEIDGYISVANVGIGIEVKYQSDCLSGENQLEREAAMIKEEWSRNGEKLLFLIADENVANEIYKQNYKKAIFKEVHLGYITWQNILIGLDDIITTTEYEELMIEDLKKLLIEKGFVDFKGFEFDDVLIKGDMMNSGENIHNAFAVVFNTLQSIEKLMLKCKADLDEKNYYMPANRFMRYSSDLTWEGWIYWSYILLFQKRADGKVMDNSWINGPVYAVEINVDSDTCDVPKLYVAKMYFEDIKKWSPGCSPTASNHSLFYNAIHGNDFYEEERIENNICRIIPNEEYKQKISDSFWGFQKLIRYEFDLVKVNQENYKQYIFRTIEKLSMMD